MLFYSAKRLLVYSALLVSLMVFGFNFVMEYSNAVLGVSFLFVSFGNGFVFVCVIFTTMQASMKLC